MGLCISVKLFRTLTLSFFSFSFFCAVEFGFLVLDLDFGVVSEFG